MRSPMTWVDPKFNQDTFLHGTLSVMAGPTCCGGSTWMPPTRWEGLTATAEQWSTTGRRQKPPTMYPSNGPKPDGR